jgi:hypothetical protein
MIVWVFCRVYMRRSLTEDYLLSTTREIRHVTGNTWITLWYDFIHVDKCIWLVRDVAVQSSRNHCNLWGSVFVDNQILLICGDFISWVTYNYTCYLLKNTNMNKTVKKWVNFVNSSQNEGLSPSYIVLSIDGFHGTVFGFFFGSFTVFIISFFGIPTFLASVPLKRLD